MGRLLKLKKVSEKEFDSAKVKDRINLARTHASTKPGTFRSFCCGLASRICRAYEGKKWDEAIELLDLFQKWPGKSSPAAGYTFEQIIREARPAELLTSVENQPQKTKILMAYRELLADNWVQIFTDHFIGKRIRAFLV